MRAAGRQAAWALTALVLTAGAVAISGWPGLRTWQQAHLTQMTRAAPDAATLDGIAVRAVSASALILPERPDRALIHLRLSLTGDPARRAGWLGCDLALTDSAGRRWLPLTNTLGTEFLRLTATGDGPFGSTRSCSQSLRGDGETVIADDAFLVPSDVIEGLSVALSSSSLAPVGVSFPVKISPRPLP